ncbi:MAG: glutamate N-acetyltransferase / amino-acid N-acetyltransferase [Archaeoglobi archaeon]|nr:glutamate N-acetyltransferase / amino-acid N-acetyltransferase [Archaeoglobi archaeon]MDK2782252.1 glutamate N-acetyltransferase / amino-acid N-acetyltransferase [Archaeoglobi archaeon]
MKVIRGEFTAKGVLAGGVKEGKYGVALVKASGTSAGVFTTNALCAAPVKVTKRNIADGYLDGIIANSGCANALTGEKGIRDAERMCEIASKLLGTSPENIGVASTGVIGRYLDMELIEKQSEIAASRLSPEGIRDAARAIMTTDKREKIVTVDLGDYRISGIAKGAGMIAPRMATMLAFLYVDAQVPGKRLEKALRNAVDESFNMIVVDGDTSTNDMVLVTSTSEEIEADERFEEALKLASVELSKMIVEDGEGATTMIEVVVSGAKSREDARKVCRTILSSPLVKTAVFGRDPNWGRIACAIGNSGVEVDENLLRIFLSNGKRTEVVYDRGIPKEEVERDIIGEELRIIVDLGEGDEKAVGWGCDMSYEYIKINSEYTS